MEIKTAQRNLSQVKSQQLVVQMVWLVIGRRGVMHRSELYLHLPILLVVMQNIHGGLALSALIHDNKVL